MIEEVLSEEHIILLVTGAVPAADTAIYQRVSVNQREHARRQTRTLSLSLTKAAWRR
jgi:hypothetical protein